MWLRCLTVTALAALIQVFLFADALDDIDDGFAIEWAAVFAPVWVYLFFAFFIDLVSRCWSAFYFQAKATTAVAGNSRLLKDDPHVKNAQKYTWVMIADTTFDAIIYILVAVFFGMLAAKLEAVENGTDFPSFISVSIPLMIVWGLLSFVAIYGALRTHGDVRYQARLNETGCCSAVFGGVLCCCKSDDDLLYEAERARVDKKLPYVANAHYQQWPCAYMCSSSLTYGWPDLVLSILLFAALPMALAVTVMVAYFLDSGTPSFTTTFIAPWVLEILIVIFAVMALVWMCSCYAAQSAQPTGRIAGYGKYGEFFIVILFAILLGVQQILIAERVDQGQLWSWQAVFIPLYVLFTIMFFAGCALGWCCTAKPQSTKDNDDNIELVSPTSYWGIIG